MKTWKKTFLALLLAIVLSPFALYFAAPGALLDIALSIQRRSAGLARKEVQAGDHRIVYLEGGSGTPLVLVHGFGGNKDLWNALAFYLTPHYRVIALDMPGFGESDKLPGADYGFVSQSRRLEAFWEKLGIGKAYLVGHSMGGAIAGIYAARHPEKVRSIAFFNTAGVKSARESDYLKLVRKGENRLLIRSYQDYEKALPFVYFNPPWIPPRLSRAVADRATQASPFNLKVFRDILRENQDKKEYALGVVLPDIKARALILWGDSDRIMDTSAIPVMEKLLRVSRTVVMKNCGHLPIMEYPGETARYLLEFLQEK